MKLGTNVNPHETVCRGQLLFSYIESCALTKKSMENFCQNSVVQGSGPICLLQISSHNDYLCCIMLKMLLALMKI